MRVGVGVYGIGVGGVYKIEVEVYRQEQGLWNKIRCKRRIKSRSKRRIKSSLREGSREEVCEGSRVGVGVGVGMEEHSWGKFPFLRLRTSIKMFRYKPQSLVNPKRLMKAFDVLILKISQLLTTIYKILQYKRQSLN